uniref:Uncharacterized protein n=1 Tax=Myoviridae sp. ctjH82 TaxID=2827704 RepID=A0A8S5T7Y9_9CAUD|nr:MAG TPA: hypothetical protein [Myoviridae sp. ctjH82]
MSLRISSSSELIVDLFLVICTDYCTQKFVDRLRGTAYYLSRE